MKQAERALREEIIERCLWMNASGLNQGTSGNISARYGQALLITPSGVPYERLKPADLALMPFEGQEGAWEGPLKPSSEWRFHLDLMRARPDLAAIVHTHSVHATALSIARREIPAVHYMIAAAGGPSVRCAGYATYGTEALSRQVLKAMKDRKACLMANHGMIAAGETLEKAMWLAEELETLARQYCLTLSAGLKPVLLSDREIARVVEKFRGYGLNAQESQTPARKSPRSASKPRKRPAAR